jgi:N-acyl-L-homoserine lactone synthetase
MRTMYRCPNGYTIELLTEADEVSGLVATLERIGVGEGWTPGTAISDYARDAFHLAAAKHGQIVGGAQIVFGSQSIRLSFADIWPEAVPTAPALAHVSVLALDRAHRGPDSPFLPMCGELWRLCQTEGMCEIWHEVTPSTLRLYRRMGWPLEIVGQERMHWGEPCYLARMGVSEVARSIRAKAVRSPSNMNLVDQATRLGDAAPLLTAA